MWGGRCIGRVRGVGFEFVGSSYGKAWYIRGISHIAVHTHVKKASVFVFIPTDGV